MWSLETSVSASGAKFRGYPDKLEYGEHPRCGKDSHNLGKENSVRMKGCLKNKEGASMLLWGRPENMRNTEKKRNALEFFSKIWFKD